MAVEIKGTLELFGATSREDVFAKVHGSKTADPGKIILPDTVLAKPSGSKVKMSYMGIDKDKLEHALRNNIWSRELLALFINNTTQAVALKALSRALMLLNAIEGDVTSENNGIKFNVEGSTRDFEVLQNSEEQAKIVYNNSGWFATGDEGLELEVRRHILKLVDGNGEQKNYSINVFGEEELKLLHKAHVERFEGKPKQTLKQMTNMLMPFADATEVKVGSIIVASEAYTLRNLGEIKVFGYTSTDDKLKTFAHGIQVNAQRPKERATTVQQQPATAADANNSFLYGM